MEKSKVIEPFIKLNVGTAADEDIAGALRLLKDERIARRYNKHLTACYNQVFLSVMDKAMTLPENSTEIVKVFLPDTLVQNSSNMKEYKAYPVIIDSGDLFKVAAYATLPKALQERTGRFIRFTDDETKLPGHEGVFRTAFVEISGVPFKGTV